RRLAFRNGHRLDDLALALRVCRAKPDSIPVVMGGRRPALRPLPAIRSRSLAHLALSARPAMEGGSQSARRMVGHRHAGGVWFSSLQRTVRKRRYPVRRAVERNVSGTE